MRARVAYISSLGTTAILVAAALLMLALVNAIVAFRAWPESADAAGVQQVPLGSRPASVGTELVQPVALRTRVVRAGSIVSVAVAKARVSTAGLVKEASPQVVRGLVMERQWPVVSMHQGSRQPVISATPPPGQAFATPATPTPVDSAPVTAPTAALTGVALPGSGPSAIPPPQSPSSDQIVVMVGALTGAPPPPGVAEALVEYRLR
jgi:hypothetical protein